MKTELKLDFFKICTWTTKLLFICVSGQCKKKLSRPGQHL